MPKFTQMPIQIKQKGSRFAISEEMIEEYKGFIEQLDKNHEGQLEFSKGENLAKAKKVLIEAGVRCKKYVKVKKPRGVKNVLTFQLIPKTEFDAIEKRSKERGEKIRAARKKK
jgi:hypothetical protein